MSVVVVAVAVVVAAAAAAIFADIIGDNSCVDVTSGSRR